MTAHGDLPGDMADTPRTAAKLDDSSVETWLAGGPVPSGLETVAAVLAGMTASADQLRPVPNDVLGGVLEVGLPVPHLRSDASTIGLTAAPGPVDLAAQRTRRGRRVGTATALAVALALTSVGAAAAAGSLPDPAQNAISRVVRGLVPFSLPFGSSQRPAQPAVRPAATPAVPADRYGSRPQDPPGRAASDEPGDETSTGATGTRVVAPDAGDTGHDSPGSREDGSRPGTSPAAGTEPSGTGAGADGTSPGTDTPEPADSPAAPPGAVGSGPTSSPSPSDDGVPAPQETSGTPDGIDPAPAS